MLQVDYVEIAPCASLPIDQLVQGPEITVRSEDSLLQRVENQKGGLHDFFLSGLYAKANLRSRNWSWNSYV